MLGFKRRSYDGCAERPQTKLIKDDVKSIYEATLQKLFAGASLDAHLPTNTKNYEQASSSTGICGCDGRGPCGAGLPTNSNVRETSKGCLRGENHCGCKNNNDIDCSFCRRKICQLRSRYCNECQQPFCTSCSLSNYSERYDRAFCLDCSSRLKK